MRIADVDETTLPEFLSCLEEGAPEAQDQRDHRRQWYAHYKPLGLCAKLALDDRGVAGGMIQTLPIEHTFADGEGLQFILCIWVHGHKQGRGNFQGQGMGTALLAAAEADARARGMLGMAAWGLVLPVWMRAGWFHKHGYRNAERQGLARLLWKPFDDRAQPPRWLRPAQPVPAVPGRVTVTAFCSGWCMGQNAVCERARMAAREFEGVADFTLVDTSDPQVRAEWGRTDGVFVDGREVRSGPPSSQHALRRIIARRVHKLPRTPDAPPPPQQTDSPQVFL